MSVRLFSCFVLCTGVAIWAAGGAAPEYARARELMRSLPIRFEPNTGQWNPRVRFVARTGGSRLLLTSREAVLSTGGRSVALSFLHANAAARIEGLDPLALRADYFIGRRPEQWRTGVPQYTRVRYAGVYPGIDLVYYGNASSLEYDLILQPGADASRIRMQFRGADRVSVSAAGDLLLSAGDVTLVQKKPVIYQATDSGTRRQVAGRYRLLGGNVAGVELEAYDHSRPLTIDPVLVYSSLLGGTGSDSIVGVKVDRAGMVWVAGNTATGDLASAATDASFQGTSGGGQNVFLARFNPQGDASSSLAYFTFIGGSGADAVNSMAMDGAGNIYLAGSTTSANFPLGGNAFQNGLSGGSGTDAFVLVFNPNATGSDQMVYSSYFGGADTDVAYGIDVDAAGAFYVVGTTRSDESSFPLTSSAYAAQRYGPQDAFVAKFDLTQSPTLVYSSYLGGELQDDGRAIAVTPSGTVYIAGSTESLYFPPAGNQYRSTLSDTNLNGNLDGWIAQMDLTKSGLDSLVYSTYLGGSDLDEIRRIAIDPAGKLLVTGYTMSADFPVTDKAYQTKLAGNADAFVARVDLTKPPSSFLEYSTYLGGSDGESGYDVAADKSGNIYVTGYTLSSDFPVAGNPLIGVWKGGTEIFFARLDTTAFGAGALTYSSFLGEIGEHAGNSITVGSDGTIYVAGYTSYQDVLVTPNASQTAYGGGLSDGFLVVVGP